MELDRRFTMDIFPLTVKESIFELYGADLIFIIFIIGEVRLGL